MTVQRVESYRFPSAKKISTSSIKGQTNYDLAYDHRGVIMTDRVPCGRRVTGVYYAFMQKLRRKMHKNRPQLLVAGLLTLHDSARPNIVDILTKRLRDFGWEVLPHVPLQSRQESTRLFPKVKRTYAWMAVFFSTDVTQAIRHMKESGVSDGIMLPKRLDLVIEKQGDYIEGL